ncbi:MAG: CBS domain-containing protein [Planctomycetota bacterium]|jgi:CBS domain-containing protein|nr:CBS domain-containing protein [Planctomycetota bacterium]
MSKVAQLLQNRGHQNIWKVNPDDEVITALKLMAEKNIGAVLVSEGDTLAGIFSERDYARRVILEGKSPEHTAVKEIMSGKVLCVRPTQTIDECMALMKHHKLRHLPVTDNDEIIGIISVFDVVNTLMAEHEFIIEQLEHYIQGY